MAVSLEVSVTGSITVEGTYQLDWTVVNSTDMPAEVFLHTTSTDEFHGAASPAQMGYPTAPGPSSAYYRKDNATGTYESLSQAMDAQTNVGNALDDLVRAYEAGLSAFTVTTTTVYPDNS